MRLIFFLLQPHPRYRSFVSREVVDCTTVCTDAVTTPEKSKCTSGKWVPDYQARANCECLVAYRCCDQTCPPKSKLEECWKNGNEGSREDRLDPTDGPMDEYKASNMEMRVDAHLKSVPKNPRKGTFGLGSL